MLAIRLAYPLEFTGGTYFVLLVDGAHEACSGRQDLLNENEYGFLRQELDVLADNINELTNREKKLGLVLVSQMRHKAFAPSLALNPESFARWLCFVHQLSLAKRV